MAVGADSVGGGSLSELFGGGGGAGVLETPSTSFEISDVDTATSFVTTNLVASGTTHTKGSYTELIASTAEAVSGIIVMFPNSTTANTRWLVDIATGDAGSEGVIIPDLAIHTTAIGVKGYAAYFPVNISSGTRVAARCQSFTASAAVEINVIFMEGGSTSTASYNGYGRVSAQSRGEQLTFGVVNTKTAYTELTASTAEDIDLLYLELSYLNLGASDAGYLVDIATGDAGSEVVLIPNVALYADSTGTVNRQTTLIGPIPVSIEAGTRIAVRVQSNQTTSNFIHASVIGASIA